MPTALKEPPAAAAVTAETLTEIIAELFRPSMTYSAEQFSRYLNCDLNTIRARLGDSSLGSQLHEWRRTATEPVQLRPEVLRRIMKSRSATGTASMPPARRTPEPLPPQETSPAAMPAPKSQDKAITLRTVINDDRWYTRPELLEMLDGLDATTFAAGFVQANPVQVIGQEVMRAAAIAAREGTPWSPKPSYVAQIMANRAAAVARRDQRDDDMRTTAATLLAKHAVYAARAATVDQCHEKFKALKTKHAAALKAVDEASSDVMNAEMAVNIAEATANDVRKLAYRYPHLFDQSGSVPRLLEQAEEIEQ
jgi:hypothetical protein